MATPMSASQATNADRPQLEAEAPLVPSSPNELAVRLYLIDMAIAHLSRNHGILGLGANAVKESLAEEKDEIVKALQKLGERLVPQETRRRA
jgi:hypothetical protein